MPRRLAFTPLVRLGLVGCLAFVRRCFGIAGGSGSHDMEQKFVLVVSHPVLVAVGNVPDTDRLADVQGADIDLDVFRDVERQALDMYLAG